MDRTLSLLEHCELCPKKCGVNRLKGKKGFCGAGDQCLVAHYGPHFGEEPPISGSRGSGTIFFSPCNLRCIFCQNYEISHTPTGTTVSTERLVEIFFELRAKGVHNINLVSPTPYAPLIAVAIRTAREKGLAIPFVYNTNAYENPNTISLLNGLVDIYLPDFKYWNGRVAARLSAASDYPAYAVEAIMKMRDQVGDLIVKDGVGQRGLLIRHLVLPANCAGSRNVILWIKQRCGSKTHLSIMSQYSPLYRAHEYKLLNRHITGEEYDRVVDFVEREGFHNVFVQELDSADLLVPDFTKAEPFARAENR